MKQSSRLHAMDDVRVILMLMGVVLHAALQVGGGYNKADAFNNWSWFAGIIHVFRMQAFFALSGYLAYKTMNRPQYLQKRTRQLVLPAATALFVVFPLLGWYVPSLPHDDSFDFSSVWFLGSLYLLVIFNWGLMKTGILALIVGQVQRRPWLMLCGAVAGQVMIGEIVTKLAYHHYWATHFGYKSVILSTTGFELFYLGGLLLAQLPSWQPGLKHAHWRVAGAACLLVWAGVSFVAPQLVDNVVVPTITAIVVTLGIMSLATQTKLNLGWTKPLCAASLTVYLWHLPLVHQATNLWDWLGISSSPLGLFVWLVSAALSMSIVAHLLIERSSWLRWLCLGEQFPLTSLPAFTKKIFSQSSPTTAE